MLTGVSQRQVLFPVNLRPQYRAPGYRPRLAQFIEVKPQITVEKPTITTPISIELGGLPLSLGLFLGSGLAFLVRSGLPKGWPQTAALVLGGALSAAGIVNLVMPKKAAAAPATPAAPAAPPVPPPPPSGGFAAEEKPSGFIPPSVPAFTRIQMEMVSPAQDQEIDNTGTFFGIGTPKTPITMRFYNPMPEAVTFNMEFDWDEMPVIAGFAGDSSHGSKSFQVTLGPKEQRNEVFELPIVSSGWTSIDIALATYKKRLPEENRFLVVNRSFRVT